MGTSHSIFTDEEIADYEYLTYLSKKQIYRAYDRFCELGSNVDRYKTVSMDEMKDLPELKVNPFKERIINVFSSCDDLSMSFEDFLDMMSVFSDSSPKSIKVEYAFRIYDFDEDDILSPFDLKETIRRLTGEQQLSEEHLGRLVTNIMEEADLDEDGYLSFAEFEHVISKAPDFVNTFHILL